jgi:hypothetical protein
MQKIPSSWRVIVISALLLASVMTSAWLWPSGKSTRSGPPPQALPAEEPIPGPLPAISPEMATAIRQMSNHSTEGLKETVNPDGSITLNHEGRFQSVMVAVKGPDGKVHIGHGEDFLQNVKSE